MKFNRVILSGAVLLAGVFAIQNLQAAFIVEVVSTGRGFANFTGSTSGSSAKSVALGCTAANSVFGGGANDTYTFSYTLGTDADNFTPTIGANLGNGNLATGAAGGVSGNYNVYVTWPNSANINTNGTYIVVANDSTPVEWPAVNQNNVAPANVNFPGVNKWWCVATNVPMTAGNNYTVVSTPNAPGTFVSQRFSGVMWERTPDAIDPCTTVPLLSLTNAPYVAGTNVTVPGVSGSATKITIYQDTGSGMTEIGSKSADITEGLNVVTTTTPLAKGAILSATQTIGGQEGCVPTTGPFIGGGANPSVRIALSIRETADTGPIGASATDSSSTLIHFLGASTRLAGAPVDATIFFPSNEWQTVTIGGKAGVGNPSNAAGTPVAGDTYAGSVPVAIQVYAFKTVGSTRVFSATPAESSPVTSNDAFAVNWTWDAVSDAEGYRVIRNSLGSFSTIDVITNYFSDTNNSAWGFDFEVTPSIASISPSVQWNGVGAGSTNGPATLWGILESINFAIVDDTGAFDLYIDNIQNGETVFQTFETVPSGTQNYGFRAPSYSGTTGPLLLSFPGAISPDVSRVTNAAADTGTNSVNIQFQWNSTNASEWLRLTTSAAGSAANPLVNLDDPISFRLLLLPVGATLPPVGPPGPISIALDGANVILSWPGTAILQSSTNVAGTYIDIGGVTSPHTNTASGTMFYRLKQ